MVSGAWQATVHRVTKSKTRWKQLSTAQPSPYTYPLPLESLSHSFPCCHPSRSSQSTQLNSLCYTAAPISCLFKRDSACMSTSLSVCPTLSSLTPRDSLGESMYPYYFLSLLPGTNVPWCQCKESLEFSLASDQPPGPGQVHVPLSRPFTWVDPSDCIMSFRKHPFYLFLLFSLRDSLNYICHSGQRLQGRNLEVEWGEQTKEKKEGF